MSKSALVFGASGVTGWAFINEILHDYPKPGIWKRVHALTNRPLSQEQSQWPKDPRLNIVSGIDLLKGSQEELEATIKQKIPDVAEVTHVYYLAYKAGTDVQKELEEAVAMWKRSTMAMDHLAPNLEFVVLQTGAKMCKYHPALVLHCPNILLLADICVDDQTAATSSKTTPPTTYTSLTKKPSPGSKPPTTTSSSTTRSSTGYPRTPPTKSGAGATPGPTSSSASCRTRTSTRWAPSWAST